jgi:hypothetical protein
VSGHAQTPVHAGSAQKSADVHAPARNEPADLLEKPCMRCRFIWWSPTDLCRLYLAVSRSCTNPVHAGLHRSLQTVAPALRACDLLERPCMRWGSFVGSCRLAGTWLCPYAQTLCMQEQHRSMQSHLHAMSSQTVRDALHAM